MALAGGMVIVANGSSLQLLIAIIIGCIGSHYIFKDEESNQINK